MYNNLTVLLTTVLPRTNRLFNSVILQSTKKFVLHSTSKETVNYSPIKEDVSKRQKKKARTKHHTIDKYMEQVNPLMAKVCPQRYITASEGTKPLYLMDPETARDFASMIIKDLSKNTSFVAEVNPGLGLLTVELLKAGIPFIYLFEETVNFHGVLNTLTKEFPGRLELRTDNLFKMSKFRHIENVTNREKITEILDGVQHKDWAEKPYIQVIGALTHAKFINHLITSLVFKHSLMSYGRPVCYLAIPPFVWEMFTYRSKCSVKNITFQILFNHKLLGKVPRQSFVPWQRQTETEKNDSNYKLLYIVKIEPKPDLFTEYIRKEELLHLWYFVRHFLYQKTKKVIPELEKLVPGCGPRLIAKNYTIYTEFQDLTPLQMLTLYNEFRSWPEYEKCSFIPGMHAFLSKLTESPPLDMELYDEEDSIN